ncbi:putative glycoside hydrolase [compost metagenome]
MRFFLLVFSLACFIIPGCIKKNLLNPEADILSFQLNSSEITANTVIDESSRKIFIYLNTEAYQNGVTPIIEITKGAAVFPASGTHITFDEPVYYSVTSESGANKKTYEIVVVRIGDWYFNFENWEVNSNDQYEYPVEPNGVQIWSSANAGAALAGVNQSPGSYPTKSTTDGLNGTKGVKMTTLPGTTLSAILGIHIIPGSIFLGSFNTTNAILNPPTATEFGQPYEEKPARFSGYYKYTPGPLFLDQNGAILASETDKCSVYAVFYNGPDRLDGSNIQTSPLVIAKAVLSNGVQTNGFVHFDIPFTFDPGVTIGSNTMLAIVASSSYQGDQYRGAIGSELIIDSLRIIPE